MSWEHWIGDLNEAAEAKGFPDRPLTDATGTEMWRPYFDRGLSPGQALDEMKAAEELSPPPP